MKLTERAVNRAGVLAGFGLIVFGVRELSSPWAYIVAGVLLIAGALFGRSAK